MRTAAALPLARSATRSRSVAGTEWRSRAVWSPPAHTRKTVERFGSFSTKGTTVRFQVSDLVPIFEFTPRHSPHDTLFFFLNEQRIVHREPCRAVRRRAPLSMSMRGSREDLPPEPFLLFRLVRLLLKELLLESGTLLTRGEPVQCPKRALEYHESLLISYRKNAGARAACLAHDDGDAVFCDVL